MEKLQQFDPPPPPDEAVSGENILPKKTPPKSAEPPEPSKGEARKTRWPRRKASSQARATVPPLRQNRPEASREAAKLAPRPASWRGAALFSWRTQLLNPPPAGEEGGLAVKRSQHQRRQKKAEIKASGSRRGRGVPAKKRAKRQIAAAWRRQSAAVIGESPITSRRCCINLPPIFPFRH